MQKRTPVQLIGFVVIATAMVVTAMVALRPASGADADANVASFAPEGEARYRAVAQAQLAPTPTPANNTQRIRQLETRVATLEQYRSADIQRIIALEVAVFGAPPPTLTPSPAPATPTVAPSVTPPPATATPVPGVTPPPSLGAFDCSVPRAERNYICPGELSQAPSVMPDLTGQACPDWVHDRYIARAWQDERGEWRTAQVDEIRPSEVVWRTWHPGVDPATGCGFAHEHGFDWRENPAMSGPPAFGLIGCIHRLQHGMHGENHCAEPHEGFKAFSVRAGQFEWFENSTAQHNSYYVLHFGTSGPGRLTENNHSFEVWQTSGVAGDPWRVHIMGMPDFGLAGNICERDAGLLASPDGGGNRTLQQTEPSGCAINGGYEIWFAPVRLYTAGARDPVFSIGASSAAFGPATAFEVVAGSAPAQRLMRTVQTGNLGCKREGYHEAGWYSTYGNGPEVLYTDMHGREIAPGTPGGALQVFELPNETLSSGVGNGQVVFSRGAKGDSNIIKIDEGRLTPGEPHGPGVHCFPGLRMPN
jgi:hypothetical protein